VRVRDHLALSTAGAALLYPWFGRRVLSGWAASILIDVDHYLWFVANERRLDPGAALRFFNEAQPPPATNVRFLHTPVAMAVVAALSTRWRGLRPVAVGMAAHAALDAYHDARMDRVRAAALCRDNFTCQECGAQDDSVTAHTARQPSLLPSYKESNFVALCGPCHAAAHATPNRRTRRQGRRMVLVHP
jgi:hypothetical protein